MNIFNRSIQDLQFDDIDVFCSEKKVEGIQLEYKKEFPRKGLAKLFASMSNTRGGLIILGIEEDEKIGIPKTWDGVKNDGKLIDRVHQYAAQVEPIPSYEVCTTDENNGNVFILIRIFEGDKTPYYVQNDANIWVRTGNITNPIDIASPDALELLFRKREKAEKARSIYIKQTEEVFLAWLKRTEKFRKQLVAEEKNKFESEQRALGNEPVTFNQLNSSYCQSELGSNTAMCTILIQPYYPKKAFFSPFEIKNAVSEFTAQGFHYSFPYGTNIEMIPFGTLSFNWRRGSGHIEVEQIYGNGLIYNSIDVLKIRHESEKHIRLSNIGIYLFVTLKAASKYYDKAGYQGNIIGFVKLHKAEDIVIHPIVPNGWRDPWEYYKSLMSTYTWDIDIDTNIIRDNDSLKTYFKELMNEIYVSFNYAPPPEKLYEAFFKDCGW